MVKISIITPVYNNVTYIENCIINVIQQNCPVAEHVLVDGGSTDGTTEIIQKYAERYPHICWISEKDQGQSDAMNKGIRMAKGSVISFLNVDDFYEPQCLNQVDEVFKNLPSNSFLVGNCKVWDDTGKLLFINKPKELSAFSILRGKPFPNNPSAYFYHKSLHDRVGLYSLGEHYAMDLEFLLRALPKAKVKYVDVDFGNWRKLPGTKTVEDEKVGEGERRRKILFHQFVRNMSFGQKLMFKLLPHKELIEKKLSKLKLYRTAKYYIRKVS